MVIVFTLQLQMQSVSKVVSSKSAHGDTTLCDKVKQSLKAGRWFSLGTPVSSTNITDRHDILKYC